MAVTVGMFRAMVRLSLALDLTLLQPVSFELKEGAKPYHSRAFPIPRVHKETIMKEIKRLIELGVLEW